MQNNVENTGAEAKNTVNYQTLKEEMAKVSERLGEGWESETLKQAEDAISELESRVAELEAALAQVEANHQWRRERQREGIAAAQERGVTFGRPRMPVPDNFEEAKQLWLDKKISSRQGAKMVGISQD
ncbi:MAG: hypothetical protein LUH42_04985, partial [Oscillospiraceae bacterium]|nr:hypothetical protein [Oscillospiraceae bacterium]